MAIWIHPELGEVEVTPKNEADEVALQLVGLRPKETAEVIDLTETPEPKPRKSRKG